MATTRRRAQPRAIPRRPLRSTQRITYREPSSDDDESADDAEYTPPPPALRSNRTTKRKRSIEPSLPLSSESEDSSNQYTPRKKRVATKSPSISPASSTTTLIHCADNTGKIPDWTSLPYDILRQIFDYASFPLWNERLQPYATEQCSSVQWLLNTSRVCRKFAEPCLSVLYQCPALAPMSRAHRLVQHLKADQDIMLMKYRTKIESIQFEVASTAAYSYAGSGTLDLYSLIHNAPRLKDLEIYHEKDMSPYRDLTVPIKWSYPDTLFEALAERWSEEVDEHDRMTNNIATKVYEHGPIRLRSWRWSSRLAGKKQSLDNLAGIHLTASFRYLKKIAFVNYHKVKLRKGQADPDHEASLAEAIAVLPNLQHLVFESCTLLDSKLMSLLPGQLQILEIINCSEVDADDMTAFLVSKGSHIHELILNHNQSLSLSFMPVLASACPRLEILRMNFNYYNTTSTACESEPNYDRILYLGETPTWPSSLRIIDLHQVRNWDIDTAEMFLTSIVNSSAQLPHLRELTVKAMLTIGWKVRAAFRTKWIGMLENVFVSRRPDPDPTWTSIGAYRSQKEAAATSEVERIEESDDEVIMISSRPRMRNQESQGRIEQASESRRSARLQLDAPVKAIKKSVVYQDSVPSLERGKRSTRCRITYAELETSDESEDDLARNELLSPPGSSSSNRQFGSGGDQSSDHVALNMTKMSRELTNLYTTARRRQRSKRCEGMPLSSPPTSGSDSDDKPLLKKRKGTSAVDIDSDDEPLVTKKGKKKVVAALREPPVVQGMCNLVRICFDNMRPREELLNEGDFLDSDPEDDSEWEGYDRAMDDEEIAF